MKLNNLKPAPGTTKNPQKRLGRGQGSGKGGTSTRGNKGAQARSGYEHKIGFEGGQMPLQRRLPKNGFKNPTRVEYQAVNVSALQKLAQEKNLSAITLENLYEARLAKPSDLVKILGNGELKAKIDVTADAFSKSAIQKIEAAGGKAIIAEE